MLSRVQQSTSKNIGCLWKDSRHLGCPQQHEHSQPRCQTSQGNKGPPRQRMNTRRDSASPSFTGFTAAVRLLQRPKIAGYAAIASSSSKRTWVPHHLGEAQAANGTRRAPATLASKHCLLLHTTSTLEAMPVRYSNARLDGATTSYTCGVFRTTCAHRLKLCQLLGLQTVWLH